MKNWEDLSTDSPILLAEAVKEELENGNIAEAQVGLQTLIDAMSRSDRRAMESFLTLLMAHVIKWKAQPEKRSVSWAKTILNARRPHTCKSNPKSKCRWELHRHRAY